MTGWLIAGCLVTGGAVALVLAAVAIARAGTECERDYERRRDVARRVWPPCN